VECLDESEKDILAKIANVMIRTVTDDDYGTYVSGCITLIIVLEKKSSVTSPARDVVASPNCGICDTAEYLKKHYCMLMIFDYCLFYQLKII
jgi:hypothetical protein